MWRWLIILVSALTMCFLVWLRYGGGLHWYDEIFVFLATWAVVRYLVGWT